MIMPNVINNRGSLHHTRQAIQQRRIRIGFLGGSITESGANYRSYSEKVTDAFAARYPDVQVTFRNAGIGATGSPVGVFRVDEALLNPKCDLVFLEFAVNDEGYSTQERNATREGLIRKLLKAGCDVVVLYSHSDNMMKELTRNECPSSIREFEALALYYRLPSVWMGLYALNAVRNGILRYEEWLPDRLHPETTGSWFYGKIVCEWLFTALDRDEDEVTDFPEIPMYTDEFEHTHVIRFDEIKFSNPWKLRSISCGFQFQEKLETSAIGATIEIPFAGTGMGIVQPFGRQAAALGVSVDGEDMRVLKEIPSEWEGDLGYHRYWLICRGLPRANHIVKLTNLYSDAPGSIGTRLAIAMIGIIE